MTLASCLDGLTSYFLLGQFHLLLAVGTGRLPVWTEWVCVLLRRTQTNEEEEEEEEVAAAVAVTVSNG